MKFRAALLVAAAVVTMVATSQFSATASPADANSFASQAEHAGLTATQAAALQRRVDAYVEKDNGTQVAANEIRFPGGGDLLLTLPGEARARHLDASPNVSAGVPCPARLLCAYSATNWNGDMLSAGNCGFANRVNIPWSSEGSWNYTKPSPNIGSFWNDGGDVQNTGNGPSAGASINWNIILYMIAC